MRALLSPCWEAPGPGPTPGYRHPGKGGPAPRCHPNLQKLGKGREGDERGCGLYQLSDGPEAVGSVPLLFPLALYKLKESSASWWPRKKSSQGCDHLLYIQEVVSKSGPSAGASAASPPSSLPPPAPAVPGGCKTRRRAISQPLRRGACGSGGSRAGSAEEPSAAFIHQPRKHGGSGVASSVVQPSLLWGLQLPGRGGAGSWGL